MPTSWHNQLKVQFSFSKLRQNLRKGLGMQTESLVLDVLSVSYLLDVHMLVLSSQLLFKSGVQGSGLGCRLN